MKLIEITVNNLLVEKCVEVLNYMYSSKYILSDEKGYVNEQNFILSFAYLFGCIVQNKELLVGGELKKGIQYSENEAARLLRDKLRSGDSKDENIFCTKPDLIIHSDIKKNRLNNENQKLIIEAKTTREINTDSFCWDLFKLREYISQLNFNYAIYLIVNQDKDSIEKVMKQYIDKELPNIDSSIRDKLLFLIQENERTAPVLYKIEE